MVNKRDQYNADRKQIKPDQVKLDIETDKFSVEEQEDIVRMVKQDIEADIISMEQWIEQRKKDIQSYEGERPSIIENLSKEEWMSDRNMGLCAANCDAYQATLMATCYNLDTLQFKATEENDVERKEQLEMFTVWGLGKKEADFFPEVDDFIHNKITQGISYFHIRWEVWYEYVDRRIPKYNMMGKFKGYDIKTEYKRFERGVIENIPDVSDLLFPSHGKTLQDKAHLIYRVHKTGKDILALSKSRAFVPLTEDYVNTLKTYCYDHKLELLGDEKREQLGIEAEKDLMENDLRLFPIDIFQWYGTYKKKGGYEEEYRFTVEPKTNKFLAGKPLRKITRSGKRPFVGSPFIRRPGFVRGTSLPHLIEDPVNAFNNTYNQKSDFQYVENCPFGWYSPDEAYKGQEYKITPGVLLPTSDPNSINMPNLSRSMAWAESDFKLFYDVIERLTGAASYFQSRGNQSDTLGQDEMIAQNADTRFSVWVNRIIGDISEAVTMWIEMYQDWGSPDLGERVLGEDGKKLFKNFSIETIRGGYDAKISPDIISGSKTYDKQVALWALDRLSQTLWFDPMINPKGSWGLTVNAAKKAGFSAVEKYMPPEPKAQFADTKIAKDKWTQIKQGDMPTVEEGDDVMTLYMAMNQLSQEKRDEIDPEYLPNLELFLFQLNIAMMKQMQQRQQEQQANRMAQGLIKDVEEGRVDKKDVINA